MASQLTLKCSCVICSCVLVWLVIYMCHVSTAQRSAQERPAVERQDLDRCSVLGGQQMVLTGQNFTSDSKVIFSEKTQGEDNVNFHANKI